MTFISIAVSVILIAVVFVEIMARLLYKRKFLVPFHPKVVGEYPYKEFVELKDPPLQFQFKKGFRSKMININRFSLRGPEPAKQGRKKRLLIAGESEIFGAKLLSDDHLWSIQLHRILTEKGSNDWEVINGGIAGYNLTQYLKLWDEEIVKLKPEILLVRMGLNEISQAYAMGANWKPGAPWPIKLILDMQRKTPKWKRPANHSCTYNLMRNKPNELQDIFKPRDGSFQWDLCKKTVLKNLGTLIDKGKKLGCKVAVLGILPVYSPEMSNDDKKRIESVQRNWRKFYDGWAKNQFELDARIEKVCREKWDIPYVNMKDHFWNHSKRFELYIDLVHLNAKGHQFLSSMLYGEIEKLGWWR